MAPSVVRCGLVCALAAVACLACLAGIEGRELTQSNLSCTPLEERPLLAGCRYFQPATYAAVKAGTFPAGALLTNRLSQSQACEIGCLSAIQRTPCFETDFKELAQNVCYCRASISPRCVLALDEVLPVVVGLNLARSFDMAADRVCNSCWDELLGNSYCQQLLPVLQDFCLPAP